MDNNIKNMDWIDNSKDPMWFLEISKLQSWLFGKGADIGCGCRTIGEDIIRVDIDKNVKPDVVCSGDKLPFKDGELDYIISIHSFEHFEDSYKTLKEWLRVIKSRGIIGIVHPDVNYTFKQKPVSENQILKENPYYKHWHEHTQKSFIKQLSEWKDLPFKIVDFGSACDNWSFFIILKKL